MKQVVFLRVLGILLLTFAMVFIACDMSSAEEIKDAAEPKITQQPQGGSIRIGETHSMSIQATGNNLSYQWYSYRTPIQYENHLGDLIQGATGISYTTPVFNNDGIFNYYVIITNTDNKATGRRTISVQSASAMIGVNDSVNAMFPIITQQPANVGNVIFRKNMDLPVLKVLASSGDDGDISYQWFVTYELTNESGEEVPNATAADFRPVPEAPGNYYYFVKVTNTNYDVSGRRQSFSISNPAFVQVIPNPNAETPVISSQPAGAIYFADDTVRALTVDAEAEDGGVLSYQWQVSTTSATAGFANATTGTGGTTASFTPALNLATPARNFYRVVITNYAQHATSVKTATATSNAAEIVVTTPAADTFNLTIGISNLTTAVTGSTADARASSRASSPKNQFVRGFGVMDVAWENFPNLSMADVDTMFNPDKLGYNVLRNMILPHDEDPVVMLQEFTNTSAGRFFYDTVRLVNYYGGYVLSSPWTPPAVWKSNNSTIGSPSSAILRNIYYRNYANYLRIYAQAMANNGAPIYTVSIQNEPNHSANYDGCNWSGEQMRDFFVRVGYFTRAGVSGTDNINWPTNIPGYGGGKALDAVLPMSGSSANNPNIHNAALNEPNAKKNLAIVARHPYGNRNNNLAGQLTSSGNHNATYNDDPREVWETEFNLNTPANYAVDSQWPWVWGFMNSVDQHIRNNHENVYVWWAGKRFYSMIGDNEYGTYSGQILPRGWALAHWAKFAKETYHVGITASGTILSASGTSTPISFEQDASGNLNPKNYSDIGSASNHGGGATVSTRAAKITAFVKLKDDFTHPTTGRPMPDPFPVNFADWNGNVADIEYISFVMYTPTDTDRTNGFSLGDVKLVMPAGFKIRGAEAMRSSDPGGSVRDVVPVWETVGVSADRNAAYINLPRNQILSVRLYNE